MAAKFEVQDLFSIRGRGLVLMGWINGGKIRTGMTFALPGIPGKLTILALEWPAVDPKAGLRRGLIGLLFSLGSDEANAHWRELDVVGQTIDIYEPDE